MAVGAASQWHRPLACGLAQGWETPPLPGEIIEGDPAGRPGNLTYQCFSGLRVSRRLQLSGDREADEKD